MATVTFAFMREAESEVRLPDGRPRVRVIGPRDAARFRGRQVINTTARAGQGWSSGLSPFALGPCRLYGGRVARLHENAWQFSKVYACHADSETGEPTAAYFRWARAGWASPRPQRYPMGRGAAPLYSYWGGERLGYVEARQRIYFGLYRDAVLRTGAYALLKAIYEAGREVVLFDFDGYDHLRLGLTLRQVIDDPSRRMGHAFVLACMLELGDGVTPEEVE